MAPLPAARPGPAAAGRRKGGPEAHPEGTRSALPPPKTAGRLSLGGSGEILARSQSARSPSNTRARQRAPTAYAQVRTHIRSQPAIAERQVQIRQQLRDGLNTVRPRAPRSGCCVLSPRRARRCRDGPAPSRNAVPLCRVPDRVTGCWIPVADSPGEHRGADHEFEQPLFRAWRRDLER